MGTTPLSTSRPPDEKPISRALAAGIRAAYPKRCVGVVQSDLMASVISGQTLVAPKLDTLVGELLAHPRVRGPQVVAAVGDAVRASLVGLFLADAPTLREASVAEQRAQGALDVLQVEGLSGIDDVALAQATRLAYQQGVQAWRLYDALCAEKARRADDHREHVAARWASRLALADTTPRRRRARV